jgi:hypothetical protein
MNKKICISCGGNESVSLRKAFDLRLCKNCIEIDEYKLITKTRCKSEYKLNDNDLELFEVYEVKNPHFSKAAPMKLYKLKEIKDYLQYKNIINQN